MSEPIYTLKAEFFKTLGHPARIRILELLAEREHSVTELLPELGLESSHLSQQLAVLRKAGMVVARKQGNNVIYSIASKDMAEVAIAPVTGVAGALELRHVGCGACNGCELVIARACPPVYDAERFGAE